MPITQNPILEARLLAEANRAASASEAIHDRVLERGLNALEDDRQRDLDLEARGADVLVMTTTADELRQVREVAELRGYHVKKRAGRWYITDGPTSNRFGALRVAVVKVGTMGAFGQTGAAATCFNAVAQTQATTVVLVGIAFGVRPTVQNFGDVVVSESLFLYDKRQVTDAPNPSGYEVTYEPEAREYASDRLVELFQRVSAKMRAAGSPIDVAVGVIASGGARVNSEAYRDELIQTIGPVDPFVLAGEMEAAGIASTVGVEWVVVKGICDFADVSSRSAPQFPARRMSAARNAATVLYNALQELK